MTLSQQMRLQYVMYVSDYLHILHTVSACFRKFCRKYLARYLKMDDGGGANTLKFIKLGTLSGLRIDTC